MRRLLVSIFLIASAVLHASGVRVLQAEMLRGGKFQPDYSQFPGVTFIQGTPFQAKGFPGVSDHATNVARILLDGPAKGHVESVIIAEAVSFYGPTRTNIVGLAGTTNGPWAPVTWDVENHSWGGSNPLSEGPQTIQAASYVNGVQVVTPLYYPGILLKFAQRLEASNVVACVACNNASDPDLYHIFSAAQSPNIIKVASSISGWKGTPDMGPDICAPIYFNSYADPTVCETVIAMIAWAKDNAIPYKAADVKKVIVSTAIKDGAGRPLLNHEGAMKAFQALYSHEAVTPKPIAPPVVVPPVAPPVAIPPVVTAPIPTPAPVVVVTPTPTPTPAPVVKTPDQICQDIAVQVSINFDPATHTFSAVTTSKVHALNAALATAGL